MNSDKQQLLNNLYGLVGELQAATVLSTKLAKKCLSGEVDIANMTNTQAKIIELGLKSLEVASHASQQIHALSATAVELAGEGPKTLTEGES